MGLLDDAIREHLELKRRHGASPEEVERQEQEALGPARRGEFARPDPGPEPDEEPAPAAEPWLDEPDEVPAEDALEHHAAPVDEEEEEAPPPAVPGGEDVLEE